MYHNNVLAEAGDQLQSAPLPHHLIDLIEVDDAIKHAHLLTLRALGLLWGIGQKFDWIPKGSCHASTPQSADLTELMAALQPKWTIQDVLRQPQAALRTLLQ